MSIEVIVLKLLSLVGDSVSDPNSVIALITILLIPMIALGTEYLLEMLGQRERASEDGEKKYRAYIRGGNFTAKLYLSNRRLAPLSINDLGWLARLERLLDLDELPPALKHTSFFPALMVASLANLLNTYIIVITKDTAITIASFFAPDRISFLMAPFFFLIFTAYILRLRLNAFKIMATHRQVTQFVRLLNIYGFTSLMYTSFALLGASI
jgi:hypothetical protein